MISANCHIEVHLSPNNRLQYGFSGIGHDLRVNPAIALEQAEHDRFATGATPTLAADALGAEVQFIDLPDGR